LKKVTGAEKSHYSVKHNTNRERTTAGRHVISQTCKRDHAIVQIRYIVGLCFVVPVFAYQEEVALFVSGCQSSSVTAAPSGFKLVSDHADISKAVSAAKLLKTL
jgi:hypothetical protein